MVKLIAEPSRKIATRWQNSHGNSVSFIILILFLLLTACDRVIVPTPGVTVHAALPTSTPEPTFTLPSPAVDAPQPLLTATAVEPTATPTPQSVALSGRILDQDTNQPVAGATVRVGTASATTDAEGRYALSGLPPGQYVLSVTHPDYDPGLSSVFTLAAGQEFSLDLALYAPDTSPYPKDPMLTNPLDPNGAPTAEDSERLARLQGLTGDVVNIREVKLSGEYLVNYKIGEEVRAAVAELNHDVWELTDEAGRAWWIIQVCGNLASPLPAQVAVATPQPRPLPPMAEVLVDELIVKECASEECADVGIVQRGAQVEVIGCLADGGWCQVRLPGGRSGWCAGSSLRQLAVVGDVPVVEALLLTPKTGKDKIAFLSNRDRLNDSLGRYELYVMNPDGSQQTRITTAGLRGNPGPLVWLPGTGEVFYDEFGSRGIGVINLSDGSKVPWQFPVSHDGSYVDPSPDGGKLVYAHRTSSAFTNIYVVNRDGTNLRQLTDLPDNVSAFCPSWSPSGDKIAFEVQDTRPESESYQSLWVMNADGSGKLKLADVQNRESAWSPDGNRIAFECFIPGTTQAYLDICVINSDGTDLISLTHFERHQAAWHPTWSPDGKRIALYVDTSTNAGRQGQVYVINADGTGLTQLTFEGSNCCPAWSR